MLTYYIDGVGELVTTKNEFYFGRLNVAEYELPDSVKNVGEVQAFAKNIVHELEVRTYRFKDKEYNIAGRDARERKTILKMITKGTTISTQIETSLNDHFRKYDPKGFRDNIQYQLKKLLTDELSEYIKFESFESRNPYLTKTFKASITIK